MNTLSVLKLILLIYVQHPAAPFNLSMYGYGKLATQPSNVIFTRNPLANSRQGARTQVQLGLGVDKLKRIYKIWEITM